MANNSLPPPLRNKDSYDLDKLDLSGKDKEASPTPQRPLGHSLKPHSKAEEAQYVEKLIHSRKTEIICEGEVNLEESKQHHRSHQVGGWTASTKWHSRYLTLLSEGTLVCESNAHHAAHNKHLDRALSPSRYATDIPSPYSYPASATLTAPPSAATATTAKSPTLTPSPPQPPSPRRASSASSGPSPLSRSSSANGGSSGSLLNAPKVAMRVPLQGALCVRCPGGVAYGKRPHAFSIQTRSKDYFFAVADPVVADYWVECITDAIAALEGTSEEHHIHGHGDKGIKPPKTAGPSLRSLRMPSGRGGLKATVRFCSAPGAAR